MQASLIKEEPEAEDETCTQKRCHKFCMLYQACIDKLAPYKLVRWGITCASLLIYALRILYVQGFHVVTYALGIYLLNLFIGFLTPKIDPAIAQYTDEQPTLPTTRNEEFRPFIRRVSELKFWQAATQAILISLICTFFRVLDIPVFWPILVMYFFLLFGLTMKRQIKHMIRYRYLPFTYGKPRHIGKEDTGKVIMT